MARGRMIDKRVSNSKKLGKISDKAARLYFMIYPHLDKKGRIAFDDLGDLKTEILPLLKGWGLKKIGLSLNELSDAGLIQMYLNQKKISMQFERFKDFQTIREDREAASKIVAPGETPESSGVFRITPALSLSLMKLKEGRKKETKQSLIKLVIDYFNKTTGQKRSHLCDETNKLINGRIEEGRTFKDFKHVIDTKTAQWLNDPKMRKYIRPSTLFRQGNFEDYLNEPYEDPKKKPKDPKEKEKREFNAMQKKALEGK